MLFISRVLIKASFLAFAIGSAAAVVFPVVSPVLDGIQPEERAAAQSYTLCVLKGAAPTTCTKE